jgi:choline dehydrogenase-like flavoprotein
MKSADVVIVGAGGDGPAAAMRLGQLGIDVLVLEAGPWHGNEEWPTPHEEPGGELSGSTGDLSGELLEQQWTKREQEMAGKLRWGPADYDRGAWRRQGTVLSTIAGVGGTTLHYTGCHPRAYPSAIDDGFPIDYADLVPYYREAEERLNVTPAPTTHKEELYYQGCRDEYDLITSKNVDSMGYRPQPNALLRPDDRLRHDGDYDGDFTASDGMDGDTLAGVETVGNPHPIGADYEEKAKRSSNVGFVPPALETGNVRIRPNAFVTDVHTESVMGAPQATGVTYRDTWDGTTERVDADVVVLAAGAIETPRLWLNSDLPNNEWVGKGMTLHYGDAVIGLWEEAELEDRLGQPSLDPHKGQNIAARFDMPGTGCLQTYASAPGVTSIASWGGSRDGFAADNQVPADRPWDSRGRIVGRDLKRKMSDYRRTFALQALTDDEPRMRNGITVQEGDEDEHGPVPNISYEPSEGDLQRRTELMEVGARIFKNAGAAHVHRLDAAQIGIHIHSTMRMGFVTDSGCEAKDLDRLFVADHSVLSNGVGGPNPTNTGQALALRTAEKVYERYFETA